MSTLRDKTLAPIVPGPSIEPNPLSVRGLIAWLEKQPGDREYWYDSPGQCLCAQYFTAVGFNGVSVGPNKFWHSHSFSSHPLPPGFKTIAQDGERTMSDALQRARAYLEQHPEV